nr:choice-of-anchor D domain-containing protein [Rufibacter quisquiliarum]
MKQFLRYAKLRADRGDRKILFLLAVSFFLAFDLYAQVASLPTAHGGPWQSGLPTGWVQKGLGRDNLSNYGDNAGNSASFDTTGDSLVIHFDRAAGQLNYNLRASAGLSTGIFNVLQSADGKNYTSVEEFTGNELTTSAKAFSSSLAPTTRHVKFLYELKAGSTIVNLDAVSITTPNPEISVEQNGTVYGGIITTTPYSFGSPNIFTTVQAVFKIKNTGSGPLAITSITLSGGAADQYRIISQPAASVPGNGETTFTVAFTPTSATVPTKEAVITIANNDADEPSYVLNLTGTAISPITELYYPDGFAGESISIFGTDLGQVTTVAFNGVEAEIVSVSETEVVAIVPEGATTGRVTVFPSRGAVATSPEEFIIWNNAPPVVTSFDYQAGGIGTTLTLTGENFTSYFGMYFLDANGNQIFSNSIEFISPTEVRGVVPPGAVTGKVYINDILGLAESPSDFTVSSITAANPNGGPIGTPVTVEGVGIAGNIASVTINGKNAFITPTSNGFTTEVPLGATEGEGEIVAFTAGGGSTSFPFFVENTLPVELVKFEATSSANGTALIWQTATELNNDYFEVQSTTDLRQGNFSTLARISSKVTTSAVLTDYSYLDMAPAKGAVTYYRLKQVDIDGGSEYSKVIAVEAKGLVKANAAKVYPNPFTKTLTVELDAEENDLISFSLSNFTGQKLIKKNIQVRSRTNKIELPIDANIAPGLYFVTVELNGHKTNHRLIKE